MIAVIYRFKVKPGVDAEFIDAWSEVTKAYRDSCGSLGSRLHKNHGNEYIAYAQWPSEEVRNAAQLPKLIVNGAQKKMRDSCEEINTIAELTSVVNYIISN